MDNPKWCRNLNFESGSEMNRMRMMAKQKLEIKRNRQHQTMITSTRPQSSRSIKPVYSLSMDKADSVDNESKDSFDSSASSQDTLNIESSSAKTNESKINTTATNSHNNGSRSADNGDDEDADADDDCEADSRYDSKQKKLSLTTNNRFDRQSSNELDAIASTIRRNVKSAFPVSMSESRLAISKSVNNLPDCVPFDESIKANQLKREMSMSAAKLGQATLNPLSTILNSYELFQFATSVVPKNKIYQCTIIRDKKGFDRSLYPTYYMHLQAITNHDPDNPFGDNASNVPDSNDTGSKRKTVADIRKSLFPVAMNSSTSRQVFMLSGRRRKKSKTYLISCDPFDITRANCIAKLKSNVIGTQFNTIWMAEPNMRKDHVTVIYETNVLGFKGPRKMTVLIPKLNQSMPMDSNLYDQWKRDRRSVIELKNKTPVWNEETQSYVLNFRGRVTQASVKNFQLIPDNGEEDQIQINSDQSSDSQENLPQTNVPVSSDQNTVMDGLPMAEISKLKQSNNIPVEQCPRSDTQNGSKTVDASTAIAIDSVSSTRIVSGNNQNSNSLALDQDVCMQFGRIGDKEFTCDVTWPLSLLQAFAIALSSFDSKLACE